MKVLLIDNGNLSTYALAEEFEKRNCEVHIYRNDIDLKTMDAIVRKIKPQMLVLSSGPGAPAEAGNCTALVQACAGSMSVFGIGLGMLCIVAAFEGKVSRAPEMLHGRTCRIEHDNMTVFKGVEAPLVAGCYCSTTPQEVPYCLEISARNERGTVMAVRHKELSVEGVQFHPESIFTPQGGKLMDNLISLMRK